MKADFPFARTLLTVESWRGSKNDLGEPEYRYYLSSSQPDERTPARWIGLIRGHWAGVENRNHWRKDACWLEDKTRSRNPNIVGSLILLRNALLLIYSVHRETYGSLPAFTEAVAANSRLAQKMISKRL
jgi:predicted transposase YbfD/YdcC